MNPLARRLLQSASAGVDRAVVVAMELGNRRVRARAGAMSDDERLARLAAIRASYGDPALLADPDAFFPPPPPVTPREQVVGGRCLQLSWPSASTPYDPGVRDGYLAHAPNRTAHARLYAAGDGRPTGRPAVILVHGYLGGQWAVEERVWPLPWLARRGLDAAVFVLPFHGVRGRTEGGAPPFPGADPRFTNEGFRQAVADLRVLLSALRARGAPAVGMMGMSLGGYTTALMATLEPGLAFAVPLIPLASVADFARDQGRLGEGPKAAQVHAALEAANAVVSPLSRPSQLAASRMLVVGAEGDRVTPVAHAERLASHLGAPLMREGGGHLVQVWRRSAFRAVRAMLEREGIVGAAG